MRFFDGKSEYFVVRTVGFLGLFTFHTYTSIAVLFAFISFFGIWMCYNTFVKLYPNLTLEFAIAFLFLPSIIFWGSGIMKDSITISAVGWLIASVYWVFVERRNVVISSIIILVSLYTLFIVKIYVLFALVPSILLWIALKSKNRIKIVFIRRAIAPFLIVLSMIAGYIMLVNISAGDIRYDFNQIGERTRINAEYLYYVSNRSDGSAYYLGKLDGSIESMVKLIPNAINVTLFRPYLWEVKNPLMLLSSLEATFFLIITLSLFSKPGIFKSIRYSISNDTVIFCLLFTIIFASAVGLNSYNFGTLSRYKIPLMPFYIAAIFILKSSQRQRIS